MKCNHDNKENQKHNPIRHMLHMILCCGLPIIIIFSLPFIARISPTAAGALGFLAPFLCPVMMGGMLFFMFRKEKTDCCSPAQNDKGELNNKN